MKYGVEIIVLFVPLCFIFTRLDQNICDVLSKAHILAGCDVTSKIETKSAALKSNLHMYLKFFGENKLLELSFVDSKMYLIKVLQSNSTITTFNESRYELYRKKNKTLYDLLTSRSVQEHLEKCYFVINESLNLLSTKKKY